MNEQVRQVIRDIEYDLRNIAALADHPDTTRELEDAANRLHGAVLRASAR